MKDPSNLAENSDRTAARRGLGRPFAKGVSGNPGGRPKEIGHVREIARQHTEEAITTLVELMRTGKTDSARAAAASELLSRAWGKPTLPLQHENVAPQLVLTDVQHTSLLEALQVVAMKRSDDRTTT